MRTAVSAAAVLATLVLPACFLLPRPRLAPEERFGNRPPDETAHDAEVWTVTPATPGRAYFYFDVPVTEVVPRVEPAAMPAGTATGAARPADDSVRVELLVRGAVPNDCYELDGITETRRDHFVDLTLRMRRPQGQACRTVVRRFHVYHVVQGRFAPGPYVFTVNGSARPYEIRPAARRPQTP